MCVLAGVAMYFSDGDLRFDLLFVQGFVMNMQPSEAEAGFDLRMPPTTDPDAMKKRIAEEWAPAVRNMTFQVNMTIIMVH